MHPEWSAGTASDDHRDLGAYVRVDGRWQAFNRDMHQDRGPDAGLLQRGLAGGAMGFYNHRDGYGLLMRYEPDHIAKLRTWWTPEYQQINLELETPELTLAAGRERRRSATRSSSGTRWTTETTAPASSAPTRR